MKNFIVLLMLAASLFADIELVSSLDKAKELAKKENKIIMMEITQPGCPACEYMEFVVFEDPLIEKEISEHFISVEYDKQKVPDGFRVFGTPTIYFLNSDGTKFTSPQIGAANVKKFMKKLKSVQKAWKN